MNGKAVEVPQEEEEFVNEDKYTTVTLEPMDDRGRVAAGDSDGDGGIVAKKTYDESRETRTPKKKIWSKDGNGVAKKKKRAFRYESKGERAATRHKQKSKSHAAKLRRTGT